MFCSTTYGKLIGVAKVFLSAAGAGVVKGVLQAKELYSGKALIAV